ncbi:MAG: hypothetical protein ORN28_08545 [Rhodoferax sp.]|nr:hypothetical protein [Rhodoferax sp.]
MTQSVVAGGSASFSVTATGTEPFTYQWKKNGTDIPGATANTYTTTTNAIEDSGTVYWVVVTNSRGQVSSSTATLSVSATAVAPAITTQPAAQSAVAGTSATFSVTATGTSLGYQWMKNGTDIGGATASSYTTPATAIGDNGAVYSVVVSNTAGTATSSTATLSVTAAAEAPAITTQPAPLTVTAGQTASFSVIATGTGPLHYQWRKNDTDISGATASSYTTPATSSADNGARFSVSVSNVTDTVTSNTAILTVTPLVVAPAITFQGEYTATSLIDAIEHGPESVWLNVLENLSMSIYRKDIAAAAAALPLYTVADMKSYLTTYFKNNMTTTLIPSEPSTAEANRAIKAALEEAGLRNVTTDHLDVLRASGSMDVRNNDASETVHRTTVSILSSNIDALDSAAKLALASSYFPASGSSTTISQMAAFPGYTLSSAIDWAINCIKHDIANPTALDHGIAGAQVAHDSFVAASILDSFSVQEITLMGQGRTVYDNGVRVAPIP